MTDDSTAEELHPAVASSYENGPCLRRRTAVLIVVFAVVSAAPLLKLVVPLSLNLLPVQWAVSAVPASGLMTVAFWAGMGTSPLIWRLAGIFVSCAYVAIWTTIGVGLQTNVSMVDLVSHYQSMGMQFLVLTLPIAGMFAAMRLRFQVSKVVPEDTARKTPRIQFTVFHLLVLTSFAAVVLTLMREARSNDRGVGGWQLWTALALIVIIFFANTACAAWAVLGSESIRRNCLFVLLASIMLGAALAFAAGHDQLSISLFAGGIATTMIPMIGVMLSLLWLRPCGIRMIPRRVRT
jgi:hypothetical protein